MPLIFIFYCYIILKFTELVIYFFQFIILNCKHAERPTIKSQAEKQKNKNNILIKKGIANKLA